MSVREGGLPPEAEDLFALPRDEFTRARDELAKQLRSAKRRDDADAVKALRSPTLPAWTANQLARRNAAEVKELVRAGAEYRRTQKPEALQRERRLLNTLVTAAQKVLREAGRQASQSVVDRVRATLQAAAADDRAAAALTEGRLERALEPPVLETLLAAGAAAGRRRPKRARPKQPDPAAARQKLKQARADERDARRAFERAEAELERTRKALEAASARVAGAERSSGR